jgi:anti-sigma regulatory factor (Ser/Thr protein kinase)
MGSNAPARPSRPPQLVHDALLYRTDAEYVDGLLPFISAGLAASEPILVAVPGRNVALLRDHLGAEAEHIELIDMTTVGRNPGRIIPAIRQFVDHHHASRVRFVGEPIWFGRTPTEICEATRHEAMLNHAFAETPVHIRCPYDVTQLESSVVADAWRTHPTMIAASGSRASEKYRDPEELYRGDEPLSPAPPPDGNTMTIGSDDLAEVRRFVRQFAAAAGLSTPRSHDLVIAANEIAMNSALYAGGTGTLRLWCDRDTVVCEIRDSGYIVDAFAGRHLPNGSVENGRGLWMAYQLCDLMELRSSPAGTVVRLHVDNVDR